MKDMNNKPKKKWSLFAKIFLGYICVLVIITIGINIWLWGVLSRYEKREAKKDAERNQSNNPSVTQMANKPTEEPQKTPTPTPTEEPKLVDMKFKVMEGATVYVDGEAIDTSKLEVTKTQDKEFDGLYTFVNEYPEYKELPNRVTIPSLSVFNKEIYENAEVTAKDAEGKDVEILKYQDVDGTLFYSTGFNSDESKYDEVTKFAWDYATAYSYFVAGDRSAGTISGYFPGDSRYYRIVASVDTAWYTKHAELPTYSEKEVKKFRGYSNDLFYVEIYMKETIYAMYYGNERVDRDVSLGMWIANLGGSYKICGMVY